jgi:hypothetical protein
MRRLRNAPLFHRGCCAEIACVNGASRPEMYAQHYSSPTRPAGAAVDAGGGERLCRRCICRADPVRLALELLCWLQLTLTPFAAVYAYAVRQILLGWSPRWTSPQIALLAGTLRGAPTELFSVVILGVFIAVLRSKSVRRAFSEPVNSPVVPASAS